MKETAAARGGQSTGSYATTTRRHGGFALLTVGCILWLATSIAFAVPRSTVYTSAQVSPGGRISVAIEGHSRATFSAYLPGLSQKRIRLIYDQDTGLHSAQLFVPPTAPTNGFCTVRLVYRGMDHRDIRVALTYGPPGT